MNLNNQKQNLLKMLPGVDHLLELSKTNPVLKETPRSLLLQSIRHVIDSLRKAVMDNTQDIKDEDFEDSIVLEKVKKHVDLASAPKLKRTINATGVVIHTNLGRSLLPEEAIENISLIGSRYSNLEFDLSKGKRGSRYSAVKDILCEITGADAAMVVNNNAGAVLLCLESIARGKKVIVSRGELVEIGGSFRIPDVMAKSGGIMREVGTTNRTHLRDYEDAIENDTGLLLKVHKSNYSVVGFTSEVSLKELTDLGKKYHIPVMEDLGSGTFIDFSKYGLVKEPRVQDSVASGADLITFSGDKLLGGPQAGIIVGKKEAITKIKQNPITRALRIDKLTLAALESTLNLYRDEEKAVKQIPTLRMLTLSVEQIKKTSSQLKKKLIQIKDTRLSIEMINHTSRAGGGALPLLDLPTVCIGIKIDGISVNTIESGMRSNSPPIIGRIEDDQYVMDMRTIQEEELTIIKDALMIMLKKV